jgi:HK97 family phage prohead protease
MFVKPGDREFRSFSVLGLGAAEKRLETDFYAEGYATTFDVPYALWEDYKEVIDRNALAEADMSDVIMQYDHQGRVLARLRNNTLVLVPDDHGLLIAADLSKGESARQLHEEIGNGLIDRMSWSFIVNEDSYDRDTKTRRILKVKKVFDVSAVSFPANDATEISARSYVDGVIDEARRSDLDERARKAQVLRLKTLI